MFFGIIYKKKQVPYGPIPGNNQINVTSNKILEAPKIDVFALSPNGKGKKWKNYNMEKWGQQQDVLRKLQGEETPIVFSI